MLVSICADSNLLGGPRGVIDLIDLTLDVLSHRITSRSSDLAKSRPRTIEPNLKHSACVVCVSLPPRQLSITHTRHHHHRGSFVAYYGLCSSLRLGHPPVPPPSQLTKITIQPVQRHRSLPSSPFVIPDRGRSLGRRHSLATLDWFPLAPPLVLYPLSVTLLLRLGNALRPRWVGGGCFVNLKKAREGAVTDFHNRDNLELSGADRFCSSLPPLRARAVFRKSRFIRRHPSP